MNRRYFLMSSAAASCRAGGPRQRRVRMIRSGSRSSDAAAAATATWARGHPCRTSTGRAGRRGRFALGTLHRRAAAQEEAGADVPRHPQGARRQEHRRRFDRHARTTGTRCRPSGPARPARTSTSRSRARTTCSSRRQIVAAARKYNRMVQMGSQSRSSPALQEAVQKMKDGEFGEIYMARGLCFKARNTIGKTPVEPVPPGVDYDMWTGPAPMRPFTKNRFHYNWHWFWDTGNGDLGNQGIHEVDIARWGLGVTHPTKVSAIGGKFMFDDDQETPNTLNCCVRVQRRRQAEDDGVRSPALVQQPRSRHRRRASRQHHRQHLLRLERLPGHRQLQQVLQLHGARSRSRDRRRTERDKHFENFIAGVRSRKREDLNAEIEEGAMSCVLMHLANISYRWAARCIGTRRPGRSRTIPKRTRC